MSDSQQWSAEMYSGSIHQQGVQRRVQVPTNLSQPLNESFVGQRMIQPRTLHPTFNSNAVIMVPCWPNKQFQTCQAQQMSIQELQPLQYISRQVPQSSQLTSQGNHLAVPQQFCAGTALQRVQVADNGTSGVYLNPTARQFTTAEGETAQRYQMVFQGGQNDQHQTIPTQTGPYFSHQTSKRVCSSHDAPEGVRAMLCGEVQGNESLLNGN